MQDEAFKRYVMAVSALVATLDNVELVGTPQRIAEFSAALSELNEPHQGACLHVAETIDVPMPTVPPAYAIPLLGDGFSVMPVMGADLLVPSDLDAAFRETWHALSAGGKCDRWGGAESRRVLNLWVNEHRPGRVTTFILKHANRPA